MGRALDELTGLDVVLIDTAGRSPHAGEQIAELQALLEAAAVDEVHLVVSLAASRRALATAVERFAPAGVTALIATKLDEAESVGSLLSLARHSSLPLSYFTTGQDVPDDIEPARSSAAAELLLPRRAAQAPAAFSTQNSPQDHGIHAESV
jgi:flagellar biosynthesis protein FlhF